MNITNYILANGYSTVINGVEAKAMPFGDKILYTYPITNCTYIVGQEGNEFYTMEQDELQLEETSLEKTLLQYFRKLHNKEYEMSEIYDLVQCTVHHLMEECLEGCNKEQKYLFWRDIQNRLEKGK